MRHRDVCALAAASLAVVTTSTARADADGVYGRMRGDLDLSLGAGPALARGGVQASSIARALYLETAGLYATYADAFADDRPTRRSFSAGVELRPLFLPRWGSDLEKGPAPLDLALDSIFVDLGAFWASPSHGTSSRPGLELGAGFEVPFAARADGLWIGVRGALRWAPGEFGRTDGTPADRGAIAMLTLSWHGLVASHLVDVGDALRR